MRRVFFGFFILMLAHSVANTAYGCQCARGTLCEAYDKSSVVFAGTVVEITSGTQQVGGETAPAYIVRLLVNQPFKGTLDAEISVITGVSGGDCGYPFEHGRKYLVYGYKDPKTGLIYTGICSRTNIFDEATEDLDYLQGLPESATKTRLSGTVTRYTNEREKDSGFQKTEPVVGAVVLITLKPAVEWERLYIK